VSRSARTHLGVLILTLAVVLVLATPFPQAQARDATLVFTALDVLVQRHVDEPSPHRLLAAAADGLREALRRAGIRATLPDLTAQDPATARAQFQALFDQATALAAGRVSEVELEYAAVRAMAASLGDSHTGFITPEELAERQRRQRNEAGYTGVGILLLPKSGRFYIRHVFPGSPAERAGLRDFDRILAIDGQPTEGMTTEEVSGRIRGPQGTVVSLTVRRPGEPTPQTVFIQREPIVVPTVESQMLEGGIGYIRLSQFTSGSSSLVQRALLELVRAGMQGLVLDLRGNPGGFVSELNRIADQLLGPGLPIYSVEQRGEARSTQFTRGMRVLPATTPLVVLVDGDTASAAELLSAAIQDHGRGILVGTQTAGAVLISITVPLPGGAALSVAIARPYTSRGVVLEKNGLRPDVSVDLTVEDLDRGVDGQFARARDELVRRLSARTRR